MTSNETPADEVRALPAVVRQRWRIVYRRAEGAADLPQRALEDAWLAALGTSGLPLAPTGPGSRRPKVVFGPPIPVGALGARELLDVYLSERVGLLEIRERLRPVLPEGCELLDVHDVWVGAPALPAAVVALDYRVEIDVEPATAGAAVEALRAAAERLLEAPALPRVRARGGRAREYDLRPFLAELRVGGRAEGRVVIEMRLRVDPAAGAGRPDEVVRALLEGIEDGAAREALRRATADWLGSAAVAVIRADGGGETAASPEPPPTEAPEPLLATPGVARRSPGRGAAVRVVRERIVTVDEADPAGSASGPT